jgi:hypothetical protein
MEPNVKSAKVISTQTLKCVWDKVSDKPMPELYAYLLTEKEFRKTLNLIQKNKSINDTRSKEYGIDFKNKLIEALTFEFEGHMVVFVKESAPLEETLKHELKHVASWKHEDAT